VVIKGVLLRKPPLDPYVPPEFKKVFLQ